MQVDPPVIGDHLYLFRPNDVDKTSSTSKLKPPDPELPELPALTIVHNPPDSIRLYHQENITKSRDRIPWQIHSHIWCAKTLQRTKMRAQTAQRLRSRWPSSAWRGQSLRSGLCRSRCETRDKDEKRGGCSRPISRSGRSGRCPHHR